MADLSMVFDLLARDRASSEVNKVGDSMKDAGDSADGFGSKVTGMFGMLAGAAGIAGLGVGAAFVGAMESEGATRLTTAQLGLDPQESAAAGKLAGDLFAGNYGESIEHVNEAIGAVASSVDGLGEIGSDAMQEATRDTLNFATAFGVDVTEAAATAGLMIRNGLAADATEAFDLMTASFQQVPAAMRAEIPAILDEYGTNFRALGYTGEQAMAMLVDAANGGAVVLDKTGDALKELTILVGSDLAATGPVLEGLGLNAQAMSDAIATGGPAAQQATQEIAAALLAVEDPSDRATQAIKLFGTPLEDLSVDQIPAFLGAISGANGELENVKGTADTLDTTLSTGIGPTFDTLKRQAQTFASDGLLAIVNAGETGDWAGLGQKISTGLSSALDSLPGMAGKVFTAVSTVIGEVDWFGLAMKFGEQVPTLLTGLAVGLLNFDLGSLLTGLGDHWFEVLMAVVGLALTPVKVVGKIGELLGRIPLVGKFLEWMLTGIKGLIDNVAGWVASVVGGFARGFLGGGGTIVGAIRGVFAHVTTTLYVWADDAIGWFRSLPGRFVAAAEALGAALRAKFSQIAGAMGQAIGSGVNTVVGWFQGLGGRIMGGLGNLGSLLTSAGSSVIDGFLSGIRSAFGKVRSLLSNLTSMLPDWKGPAERDRTILHESGRLVMQGFEDGLTSKFGDVRNTLGGFTAGIGDMVKLGDVSDQVWDQLLSQGWKGRAGDRMEALYRPAPAYRPPTYDLPDRAAGAGAGTTHTTIVSGVASPETVADLVRREQATTEFLAGVGS